MDGQMDGKMSDVMMGQCSLKMQFWMADVVKRREEEKKKKRGRRGNMALRHRPVIVGKRQASVGS